MLEEATAEGSVLSSSSRGWRVVRELVSLGGTSVAVEDVDVDGAINSGGALVV